jgi:hypothetical protein
MGIPDPGPELPDFNRLKEFRMQVQGNSSKYGTYTYTSPWYLSAELQIRIRII